VPFDAAAVPEDVRRRLDEDPDARTYQFVAKAVPMGRPGLRELQRRLREQSVARADAEMACEDLARALKHARAEADELGAALAKIGSREGELRRSLIEAHDALLSREAELSTLRDQLVLATADLERERELRRGDQAWSAEQGVAIEDQIRQIRELNGQLRRMRRTSPVGIAGRMKSLLARARG
jgi:chromosome segregation ATPase